MRPDVAGLAWDGALGQIDPVIELEGLEVTRQSRSFRVRRPRCARDSSTIVSRSMTAGFPDDPSRGGLDFTNVTYRTPFGSMGQCVDYAMSQGADELILVGYSTGAALHMAFLENVSTDVSVRALVFDSPNIDMRTTVELAVAPVSSRNSRRLVS